MCPAHTLLGRELLLTDKLGLYLALVLSLAASGTLPATGYSWTNGAEDRAMLEFEYKLVQSHLVLSVKQKLITAN